MLGQEDVLFEVSRAFGSKIHVDRDKNPDCHYRLSHVAPEILTDDPVSRFHVMSFPRLSDRATEILALARSRQEPEPLIIRPSSQWYAYCEAPEASVKRRPVLTEPMRDEFGVWHVCLSMHSSREELEQALGILRPRWVVSTTPPCIAMDLSYVKKHCCLSRLCPDDPLWKLIGVPDGMTTVTVAPQPSERTVEAIEESEAAVACTVEEFGSDDSVHVEVAEPTLEGFEIRVEPPLTLFGRARFGLLPDESQLWRDDYASVELIDDVEIKATEQATEIGPSKEGMADKSVEVTEISEVSGKVRNLANESDGELKAIDLAEDDIHIFSKAAEFRMDDNNVKFAKANGEADQAQEQHLNAHNCMMVSEEGKNRTEAVKEISAVHTVVPSQGNMEAAEDGASPSKVHKNADNASERMGDSSTVIGSSKALSASLIRLYRSMNVPVPRPLPSLVEFAGASKRRRVSETVPL
jgi:DNA cross-link repair 1A protein